MSSVQLPRFDDWWDYNQPGETEKRFRDLLPDARAAGDRDYLAQLLTQIARAEGLGRKFDDAHRTLDEVEKLLNADLQTARVRYLLERGRVFNSSKHPAQARPLFVEAWELARSLGEDAYAVDAAHMVAILETPAEQINWNVCALEAAEQSKHPDARKWLGSLYNNLGWTYHDLGRYEDALDLFEKALRWRTEQGKVREIRIAQWCVGRALRSLNRLDEAVAIQEALLKAYQQDGAENDGYVYEELAECYHILKRPEAGQYFALAYQTLSPDPWLAANEPARLERLKKLSASAT
jgi:tetratricopeptide (TPR) repeat protein